MIPTKLLRAFSILIGVVFSLLVLSFLFLYFIAIPDRNLIDEIKETFEPKTEMAKKTRVQAQKYLDTVFLDDHYVIYNIAFETNETEHALYSYAAMVGDKKNQVEFLIYYNQFTDKMDDNYVAMKWSNDLANDIRPFIYDHFEDMIDFHVIYDDQEINGFNIDPNHPGHYKDYAATPQITIALKRQKKAEDEKVYDDFLEFLKNRCHLQHAVISIQYDNSSEDDWYEEF